MRRFTSRGGAALPSKSSLRECHEARPVVVVAVADTDFPPKRDSRFILQRHRKIRSCLARWFRLGGVALRHHIPHRVFPHSVRTGSRDCVGCAWFQAMIRARGFGSVSMKEFDPSPFSHRCSRMLSWGACARRDLGGEGFEPPTLSV
jgi:hypothetical protein